MKETNEFLEIKKLEEIVNEIRKLANGHKTPGLTAFCSVGVCFSEEQKALIKRLDETPEQNNLNDNTAGILVSVDPKE